MDSWIDEIAILLENNSVDYVAKHIKMNRPKFRSFIKEQPRLYDVLKSERRKNNLAIQMMSKKLKTKKKEEKCYLPERLDVEGCKKLAIAVINMAIRQGDVDFFESGDWELYRDLAGINKPAIFFIEKIDCCKEFEKVR